MVAALLALALAVQQPQPPEVRASVDRQDALVGDVVTLTILVRAVGNLPVRIIDPSLSGFDVEGTREATQVDFSADSAQRTTTRVIRLTAARAGTAIIGPVRVARGADTVEAPPISVSVTAAATGSETELTPSVRALVDRLPSPPADSDVVVRVIALPDTMTLGDQLDLITTAWFPRAVRNQLRTPPTLTAPQVAGVWSYREVTPPGVVASRRVGGQWYDLFLSRQTVFPLTGGDLQVGAATVSYTVPVTYSFLSREVQHDVQSDSLTIAVLPQPGAGRPTDFAGATATGLTFDLTQSSQALQAGRGASVTATLHGMGNVALWPEPQIPWPSGIRVYPEGEDVTVTPRAGRIGGTKRFTYLVVAESAGTHRVPPSSYAYFDPATGRYGRARAPALRFVVPLGAVATVSRAAPPPLQRAEATARRDITLPPWVWVAVLVLPPLIALAVRYREALGRVRLPRLRRVRAPVSDVGPDPLTRLDHAFRQIIAALVPDQHLREGDGLADALRAAGVEPAVAAHAARLRDRLRHAVFGPGGTSDAAELSAEVDEVLRTLSGAVRRPARRGVAPALALLLLAVGAHTAWGQAVSAERLYEAKAYRAAADSFLARVTAHPGVAADWYDLGDAFYQLGQDGRARAAWVRALRLSPRDGTIRRAMALAPADPLTATMTWVAPATPTELLAVAVGAWLLGWALLAFRRPRARYGLLLVLLGSAFGLTGWRLRARYQRPVGIALEDGVPLRAAPYGSAGAQHTVPLGAAVFVEGSDGAWLLVVRGGERGWVLRGEVARL